MRQYGLNNAVTQGRLGDEQVILGSTPLLDADTALTALDAAVRAYDRGQGNWPTLLHSWV